MKNLLDETRLKDIVPDIIFIAAQYTNKKLDRIARQSWDSSDELTKQIMQSIPLTKWKPFRKDVNKLLKRHSIREAYIDPDDAGKSINYALDDLKQSLKRVRNPEKWAEKYLRSLPGVIDMMERLTHIFGKMK